MERLCIHAAIDRSLVVFRFGIVFVFLLLFSFSGTCQTTFVAIPKESSNLYHFDFARNFFSTADAEKAERSRYNDLLKKLETQKGQTTASANSMLEVLQLYDTVLVQFMLHDTYLYLRYAVNTQDESSREDCSRMEAEFAERTAFLQQELMQLDTGLFSRFRKEQPALNAYSFYIESAHRYQPYTLSLKEEEIFNAVSPWTSEWQYELYQTLLTRGSYGPVTTSKGTLDARRDRRVIAADTNRSVRETGFKSLYAGYAAQRDLYALTLVRLVEARNRIAQLHHFEDAPAAAYFDSYWTKPEVLALLERIGRLADVRKRYERLRADYVKKRFGYSDVNVWDISAMLPGENIPRFTIDRTRRIIRDALSPLGKEYGREVEQLLDPKNGRLDVVPGSNRKTGGFSKGFPGVTTVFFSSGFAGYYNDVRVLTHELGHAVHRQLMKNQHVLPLYADGPHYLFESFSIFNEFLLPEYLYHNEREGAGRRYFLEQFFEGKGMEMFIVGQEEALELAIYDGVRQGTVHTADDLDSLARQINTRFSIWPDKHDNLRMNWITSSLFYEDPFYDVNYIFGALLALKYYELYTLDPTAFIPRYIALLKNGFDAPPAELLKKYLGINLHDPNLVTDAVRLLESKLNLLEKEYSQ
jgi:oligoendopeptidase F